MEELRYVVAVNLHRRHLDEFQKAQIGLTMEKIAREIAAKRQKALHYDSQTGADAANKMWYQQKPADSEEMPSASRDAQGIDEQEDQLGVYNDDREEDNHRRWDTG